MPDTLTQFKPRKAKREGVGLFVGVAGGTGSGKSYTALRLARGIAGPNGKILAGDTEGGRLSHYSDFFDFDVVDILPPFRPQVFEDLAKYAEEKGYAVLIIDSFSHEHAGDGGVLEWHDEELDRAVVRAQQQAEHPESVNEDAIRNAHNMRGWIKPKMAHKAMINSFLQRRIPIIFCMRAEEKIKVLGNGKPQPMGWMPICDKNFGYELTVQITLTNEQPGQVDYSLPRKIQRQHLAMFPDKAFITEEAGAKLAAWARGDGVEEEKKPADKPKANGNGKPANGNKQAAPDKTTAIVDGLIKRIDEQTTSQAVEAILAEDLVKRQTVWMQSHRKDQFDRLMKAADDKNAKLAAEVPPQDNEAPKTEAEATDDTSPPTEGEQPPEA